MIAALYESEVLFCSGILISRKHILTVATCLKAFFDTSNSNTDFLNYHAKLGITSLWKLSHEYYFKEVKIHRGYNLNTSDIFHNIGLITVLIVIYIFQALYINVKEFKEDSKILYSLNLNQSKSTDYQ